jgi:hypothetical protein
MTLPKIGIAPYRELPLPAVTLGVWPSIAEPRDPTEPTVVPLSREQREAEGRRIGRRYLAGGAVLLAAGCGLLARWAGLL